MLWLLYLFSIVYHYRIYYTCRHVYFDNDNDNDYINDYNDDYNNDNDNDYYDHY